MTTTREADGSASWPTGQVGTDDIAEVEAVYDAIATEYDDRVPGAGPLDAEFIRVEREFVLAQTESYCEKVLDLGCGTGRTSIPLARAGLSVVGLDLSAEMLTVATRKASAARVHVDFERGNMCELRFAAETFDAVVSTLALMHLPESARLPVFLEVARVLRPGGKFVFSAKNAVFERFFTGDRFVTVDVTDVDRKRLRFTQTRSGVDREAVWNSFAPEEIRELCARSGLTMTSLHGNLPLSGWLSDSVLRNPACSRAVFGIERRVRDIPPFSYLGYHLLAAATKAM